MSVAQPVEQGFSVVEVGIIGLAGKWLTMYLQGVPPEELKAMIKRNEDLAAKLPDSYSLPGNWLSRSLLMGHLRRMDGRTYDAILNNIEATLPIHAAMLKLPPVWPWYCKNMDALRDKLISDLSRRGDDVLPTQAINS